MSDNEHDDVQTFVRKGPGGEQQSMTLVPWQGAAGPGGQEPGPRGGPVAMMVIQLGGGGDGELRHLSYDDPPGFGSPEEWRELLARAVQQADDEEEFCRMLVMVLGKDLVLSHGCDPHVAIPAIIEFARKVYQENRI